MVRLRRFQYRVVLLLLCVFVVSCLPKTGQISWHASDKVEIDLTKGHLQPGFTYYYTGPEAIPHTIIAIRDDVPFQQNFWLPVEFGELQVKEWLQAIDNNHRAVTDMYFGGRLLDRKGNFLGIWYSRDRFYSGYIDSEGRLVILRPVRRNKEPWYIFNK